MPTIISSPMPTYKGRHRCEQIKVGTGVNRRGRYMNKGGGIGIGGNRYRGRQK